MSKSLQEEYDKEIDRDTKRIDKLTEDKEVLSKELEIYKQKVESLQHSLDLAFSLKDIKPKLDTIKDKMLENNKQAVLNVIASIEVGLLDQSKKGRNIYAIFSNNEEHDLVEDNIDYVTEYFKSQGIKVVNKDYYSYSPEVDGTVGPHIEFTMNN